MDFEKRMNKKGSEMTIGTIIFIILALVVLVVLIYGFTMGWGNFMDSLNNLIGAKSNIDDVKQGCILACETNQKYAWCEQERELKLEFDGKIYSNSSVKCNDWTTLKYNVSRGQDLKPAPTLDFSCPSITC